MWHAEKKTKNVYFTCEKKTGIKHVFKYVHQKSVGKI